MKRFFVLALVSGACMYAQNQDASEPQGVLKPQAFVRRFSVGATLSVMATNPMKSGGEQVVTTTPAFDGLYTSAGAPHRIGWGFVGQLALTERLALSGNLLIRHFGYTRNSDVFEGVDNPTTIVDERRHTVKNESTQAKFFDIPVTVRYYTKDRHDSGPRGFFELGGVLRKMKKVSTSIDTTINDGDTSCCDLTPAAGRRSTKGLVVGAGIQLIDPVGIRVVPEIRYTFWTSPVFNSLATISRRHQIEGMISLTF